MSAIVQMVMMEFANFSSAPRSKPEWQMLRHGVKVIKISFGGHHYYTASMTARFQDDNHAQ
jgi:hypothetical protein